MAIVAKDLIHEQTTDTGTKDLTLTGVNGRVRFSDATYAYDTGKGTDTGGVFDYYILHQGADQWERGQGWMFGANELVRETVSQSSNANALVSFVGGTKDVTSDIPAAQQVRTTGDQTIAGIKTFSSIPLGPGSDPTTDNQLTRKAFVQPVPASSTFAVNTLLILVYPTGDDITDGSSIAGSNLRLTKIDAAGAVVSNGVAPSGTWKNVSGATISASLGGYFVRIS